MQILNLINKEKSDIDYSISRFPDGEVQITLGEFSRKNQVMIMCRITTSEELFILMQVCDILRRHSIGFVISIYYLMSMRMDRVMSFDRPFSLSVVCDVLDRLGAMCICIYSPHSNVYKRLFKNTDIEEIPSMFSIDFTKYQVVFPDAGAEVRYRNIPISNYVYGTKSRSLTTGKIISIGVRNPDSIDGRPLLIRDDLCDGGGTFLGLAKAIREIKSDVDLNIMVDHMVNPKGIENLSKNFNHVWFTNSYKDWKKDWEGQPTPFPENVTQIDVV